MKESSLCQVCVGRLGGREKGKKVGREGSIVVNTFGRSSNDDAKIGEAFREGIRFLVDQGNRVLFWSDTRLGKEL